MNLDERRGLNVGVCLAQRGVEALDVTYLEHAPVLAGGVDNLPRLRHGRRDGFFHKQVCAAFQRFERHLLVVHGRNHHADRVYFL